MARAKSSGRSKTALAIEEINQGIDMLRKQVAKVEDLKSEGFPYRDAFRARAELQIRESIRRIFGDKSPEFQAHQHYKLRTNTPTEITETLSMLNGLIARLESKKLDLLGLSPAEPTASAQQAGTPQSHPHLTLVPPAQVTVTPLVPPVVPPPFTMSVPLATSVAASPAPATSTPVASSAQTPPLSQPVVAAAPQNSPPVQPASAAFAPSSAMPPPPSSVRPATAPTPASRFQAAAQSPAVQVPPSSPPQPDHTTAPTSPVQPTSQVHRSDQSRVPPAAPPVFESPPPIGVASVPVVEAALSAAPSSEPASPVPADQPEPVPGSGHKTRPRTSVRPAPASSAEHRAQPARSVAKTPGDPSVPRPEPSKPTPSGPVHDAHPLDLVRKICARFHLVARQLRLRREYRATLDVEDEYDVQDLFYALLRLEFDEVSSEDWMPRYTDCASRTTFFLNREGIAIVVKKTRPGVGAREIAEQLRIDAERYAAREGCSTLFCFIYDPEGRIGNPRGLEMDLTSVSDRYTVELLVAPK